MRYLAVFSTGEGGDRSWFADFYEDGDRLVQLMSLEQARELTRRTLDTKSSVETVRRGSPMRAKVIKETHPAVINLGGYVKLRPMDLGKRLWRMDEHYPETGRVE